MFQSTVWNQLHKLRHAMQRRDEGISLAGFIELDEAVYWTARAEDWAAEEKQGGPRLKKLGKRSASGKRRKTQTEVIVMVERENGSAGNIVMKVVYKTTRDGIQEAVEQLVDENRQSFKSDALQSHFVVKSLGHELFAKPLSGSDLACEELPVVHRAISLLKRYLMGTYHTVSSRYLERYLSEFSFRWNRRDSERSLWLSMLKAACFALPMTYAELKL